MVNKTSSFKPTLIGNNQGFMQDQIIVTVTHVLVDTWMLTVKAVYKL